MDDRAFHLVNLSLPKSGSATLARMFPHHRAVHELDFHASVDVLLRREEGLVENDALDAFLLARDAAARPEVDSSTFLHLAADRIPALFPEARFVIAIRPCPDWVTSFLGMMLDAFGAGGWGGHLPEEWVSRYAHHVAPTLQQVDFAGGLSIAAAGPALVEELSAYWGTRIEAALLAAPPERTMVVSTAALGGAAPDLAELVAIPSEQVRSGVHANRGVAARSLAGLLGERALAEAALPWERRVEGALHTARASGSERGTHDGGLPTEDEIHRRCSGNALVALLLLIDADPALRARFASETAEVLTEFGLGRPADFVGVRGKACPVMPGLPSGPAATDISHPIWRGWLRGGVDQVDAFRERLDDSERLPPRAAIGSLSWFELTQRTKRTIARCLADLDGPDEPDRP